MMLSLLYGGINRDHECIVKVFNPDTITMVFIGTATQQRDITNFKWIIYRLMFQMQRAVHAKRHTKHVLHFTTPNTSTGDVQQVPLCGYQEICKWFETKSETTTRARVFLSLQRKKKSSKH